MAYTYDAIGRRLTRTLWGGDITSYTYDKANRVKSVTLRGNPATYTYDLAGRLASKTLPNGINVAYQYDAADRVTGIAYAKPDNTPLETVSYAYDAGGQRIQKTLGGSAVAETAFSATYDEANRLSSITLNGEVFTLGYECDFRSLKDFAGVRGGFCVRFPLFGGTTWIRSFFATAPVI